MHLRYDADLEARPLKTPILVSLFRGIGGLVLIVTALATAGTLQTGQSIESIPTAVVVGASGILVSMVPFGLAQVILLVAKIEANTAAQKDVAILQSLHKIEGHLHAAQAAKVEGET